MRRISILFSAMLLALSASFAQTPASKDEEQLLALLKEVQTQQAQIADNQAKIDTKLADLAEAIRVARIYSKREK
jgi:NADH:ubiquinone oxidoreductase subunit E